MARPAVLGLDAERFRDKSRALGPSLVMRRLFLFSSFFVFSSVLVACNAQVLDVGNDVSSKTPPTLGTAPDGRSVEIPPKTDTSWFPTTACTPVGPTPKVIVNRKYLSARGLVADGDTLWFIGNDTTDSSLGVTGVWRVGVAGAAAPIQQDASGYNGGPFTIFGSELAYVRVEHQGSGGEADPRREVIVLRDKATNAERTLKNPRTTTYVGGLNAHASGLYWSSREYRADKPSSISRFTSTETELATLDNYSSIVTDGVDVYFTRWERNDDGGYEIRFEAVPIAGGAPRVLRRMAYGTQLFWAVVGVDGNELYFTQESTTEGGTIGAGDIRAIRKDGTNERVVVSNERFSGGIVLDPDYLTWTAGDEQQTIKRVRVTGGAVERIEGPGSIRYVNGGITVDRCNLYWAVVNPPAIYARSRLP